MYNDFSLCDARRADDAHCAMVASFRDIVHEKFERKTRENPIVGRLIVVNVEEPSELEPLRLLHAKRSLVSALVSAPTPVLFLSSVGATEDGPSSATQ